MQAITKGERKARGETGVERNIRQLNVKQLRDVAEQGATFSAEGITGNTEENFEYRAGSGAQKEKSCVRKGQ